MLNIKEFDVTPTTGNSLSHSICPLICFVNAKSGGNLGKDVIIHLRRHLNPMQVHDLCRVDPLKVIQKFSKLKNYKILACGGDGTVSYILEILDKHYKSNTSNRPPVAVLPLGDTHSLTHSLTHLLTL
jgi:diacylglycerol kinase (ATP)